MGGGGGGYLNHTFDPISVHVEQHGITHCHVIAEIHKGEDTVIY